MGNIFKLARNSSVFIFEAVTAGAPGYEELLDEGAAMVNVLGCHLQAALGAEVLLLSSKAQRARINPSLHPRLTCADHGDIEGEFSRLCGEADGIILIAPECGGELTRWIKVAKEFGERLWTPTLPFAEIAADKWQTFLNLRSGNIPTPNTILLTSDGSLHTREGECQRPISSSIASHVPFRKPWIVKPRWGVGSLGIASITDQAEEQHWLAEVAESENSPELPTRLSNDWLIQPQLIGDRISVNVIAGTQETIAFPSCQQAFKHDDSLRFLGGALPTDEELDQLATLTALQAVHSLPSPSGLCGVDLIISDNGFSGVPWVVDINPRVTTSVAPLCETLVPSFADVWANAMRGHSLERTTWSISKCRFEVDGTIMRLENNPRVRRRINRIKHSERNGQVTNRDKASQ